MTTISHKSNLIAALAIGADTGKPFAEVTHGDETTETHN